MPFIFVCVHFTSSVIIFSGLSSLYIYPFIHVASFVTAFLAAELTSSVFLYYLLLFSFLLFCSSCLPLLSLDRSQSVLQHAFYFVCHFFLTELTSAVCIGLAPSVIAFPLQLVELAL